jgi:aminopeptidase N
MFPLATRIRQTAVVAASVLSLTFGVLRLSVMRLASANRDYDLQHSRMAFRFDLEQEKVLGDVTHSVALLRDSISTMVFDSVGLTIQNVTVKKTAARFETTPTRLIVPLAGPPHAGEKLDVEVRYEGKPSNGLYFILPDPKTAKR